MQVWGYDFSVDDFGPQIPRSQRHRVHFAPYALGGEEKHGPNDQPKLYTLDALMRMNGELGNPITESFELTRSCFQATSTSTS